MFSAPSFGCGLFLLVAQIDLTPSRWFCVSGDGFIWGDWLPVAVLQSSIVIGTHYLGDVFACALTAVLTSWSVAAIFAKSGIDPRAGASRVG